MGLLLSRFHFAWWRQWSAAVCSLHFVLTNVIFIRLMTTSSRQRQNLKVSLWILNGVFWCWGNHCWLPVLLIFFSVIFQKKESLQGKHNTRWAWSRFLLELLSCYYKQLQKCWDTLTKNGPFLLQIAASHTSVGYITHLPPPLHSKLFLQVFWAWSCIAFNFDMGRRGDDKRKVISRSVEPR